MKGFSKDLEQIVRLEINAHKELLTFLSKERDAVKAFKSEELERLVALREKVTEKTMELRDKRLAIVAKAGLNPETRLSQLITENGNSSEKKTLLPLVSELKRIVQQVRSETRAHNQVVKFSLDLVNGSLSILSSASRSVTKLYGQHGQLHEKSHQVNPGQSLKEA